MRRQPEWHVRVYRVLLLMYPRRFRRRYRDEMTRVFEERHREARVDRRKTRFWLATFWDVLVNATAERARVSGVFRTATSDGGPRRSGVTGSSVTLRDLVKTLGLSGLRRDASFALRQFIKSPVLTAVSVTTLAFGLGPNIAIFGFVNAMVLRPLDVLEPERLVRIDAGGAGLMPLLLESDYEAYRDRNQSFERLSMFHHGWVTPVRIDGVTENIAVTPVSGNYFATVGVAAARGRTLDPEDDAPGASPVVVLSSEGLRRYFGGEANVVGKTVYLNNAPYTVVGVTPPSFSGTVHPNVPQIYSTFRSARAVKPDPPGFFLGRLKQGVSMEEAEADLKRIAAQLSAEQGIHKTVAAHSGRTAAKPHVVRLLAPVVALITVIGGAGLWLACSNIAMLLLARAAARRREMGIRLAMGAGRLQLVRQLLVESTLLAMAGGLGATFIAHATSRWLTQLYLPVPMPISLSYEMDWRVLAFALGISFASTLLFGVGPAVHSLLTDVVSAMKHGDHATAIGRSRTSFGLVVTQVATSTALLALSAVMVRSVMSPPHPRFDAEGVLMARVRLAGLAPLERAQFFDTVLNRLEEASGVAAVTVVDSVPLTRINGVVEEVSLRRASDDEVEADDASRPLIHTSRASRGHFETLGIPLLQGRDFTRDDDLDSPAVCIVNESLARRFWPGESPVDKYLIDTQGHRIRIVGLARDSKYQERDEEPRAYVYRPLMQDPPTTATFLVKTNLTTENAVGLVRDSVSSVNPDVALFNTELLSERIKPAVHEALGWVTGALGLVAVGLGAIGTYGLMAWSAHERRREFALRLALGASQSAVVRLTTQQALRWTAMGVALGLAFILLGMHFLRSFLQGVSSLDPVSFLCVVSLLLSVAYAASYIPASRVSASDPLTALRE